MGGAPRDWGCAMVEDQPSVIVAMQYRMGPLGFLGHASTLTESGSTGNWGLMDQQLALKWIQENIGAFGGDASNVMLFGGSAGSWSVYTHYALPSSQGLFHSATSFSGTEYPYMNLSQSYAWGQLLAKRAGCGEYQGSAQLACLRKVSVETLHDAAFIPGHPEYLTDGRHPDFMPVVDGHFLLEPPAVSYQEGRIAKVPYYLGVTADEGRPFFDYTPIRGPQDVYDYYNASFSPANIDRIASVYYPQPNTGLAMKHAVWDVWTDAWMLCPWYRTLKALDQHQVPVYACTPSSSPYVFYTRPRDTYSVGVDFYNHSYACAPDRGARHSYDSYLYTGEFRPKLDGVVDCVMTLEERALSKDILQGIRGMSSGKRPFDWLGSWTESEPQLAYFDQNASLQRMDWSSKCQLWNEMAQETLHERFSLGL